MEEQLNLNFVNSCTATSNTSKKVCRARDRLLSVVSSLKRNGRSIEDNETLGRTNVSVKRQVDSKAVRKGSPSKMTSDAIKEFYSFTFRNRKHEQRKHQAGVKGGDSGVTIMDQSSQAQNAADVQEGFMDCANGLPPSEVPPSSQIQTPVLLNVDSSGNTTQLPVIPSHAMSLPSGTQPTLVFFVGSSGMPVTGELQTLGNAADSCAPFANALFLAQPVTLNVVPQNTSIRDGVIEKAMELANFQTTSLQSQNQQPSQASSELMGSTSTFIPPNAACTLQPSTSQGSLSTDHAFSTLANISQNIVITHSVAAGENVPIDNVSQSITVQTSQITQSQGFPDVTPVAEEPKPETTDTEMASAVDEGNFEESPKMVYKKKSVLVREIMTQTGGDPEVLILGERRLEYAEDASVEPMDGVDIQGTVKKPGTPRVRRFACNQCEKKFYTNNDLRRHQTSHQDARPFICEECQKGFRTSSELNIHKAIHVQVKQYKCEFCGKEFRTKGCIKSHIKYHIGDKRHKCTECDRAFVKSADLKRHMAGHRNEKKFVCDDCGSAFTRRDNLKAHRLLHTRESVVTCDLCSKEFINAVYLKRHMHIHKQAKKKPYECQWCPKTYEQLEGLRRHIRQHVGDEKFVCKDCGKKFITSIQLKRHLWLSHDQDSPYRRSIL